MSTPLYLPCTRYKLRVDANVELHHVNAAVLKNKSTAPPCLARYTTQPAFGRSYESLVSFSHFFFFSSCSAMSYPLKLFSTMRVTLMPGKDVAMRHFVALAIQKPAVAWRDTAGVCGGNPSPMLITLLGWFWLPDGLRRIKAAAMACMLVAHHLLASDWPF